MDISLKKGEVYIKTDDYIKKTSNEIMIQITDTIAIKYILNKSDNDVTVSLINTLIEDIEYSGVVDKDNFLKIYRSTKEMYNQLT